MRDEPTCDCQSVAEVDLDEFAKPAAVVVASRFGVSESLQ